MDERTDDPGADTSGLIKRGGSTVMLQTDGPLLELLAIGRLALLPFTLPTQKNVDHIGIDVFLVT